MADDKTINTIINSLCMKMTGAMCNPNNLLLTLKIGMNLIGATTQLRRDIIPYIRTAVIQARDC